MRFVLICIVGFFYTIAQVFIASYYAKHREKYTEEQCYELVRRAMRHLKFVGNIKTVSDGQEKLPKEGGYILYSNHQGRYDSVGIFLSHDKPCRVLMNAQKSKIFSVDQMIDVLGGKRIEPHKVKQQLRIINEITDEVKNGYRYLIFPEGKHVWGMKNRLLHFYDGCFKCAMDSHAPVVPVALVDSYKAMNGNSLGEVTTQVHYLTPIYYDEYKDLTRKQLCELVRSRIQDKLNEVTTDNINTSTDEANTSEELLTSLNCR